MIVRMRRMASFLGLWAALALPGCVSWLVKGEPPQGAQKGCPARPQQCEVRDATKKERQVCARARDGERPVS